MAAASVYAAYPELQGLAGEQLLGAIHAIGRQNPQRATEIRNHIERVRQLSNISAQAQAAQQQRAAMQFKEYAAQQDAMVDAVLAREPAESVRQLKESLPKIAKERYGISEDQLLHLWHTQPWFRVAPFQLALADAVRFYLAKEASARPAPKPLPPVMKPGSGDDIPAADYSEASLARKFFNENPTPQTAAKALIARRRTAAGNRGGSYRGV